MFASERGAIALVDAESFVPVPGVRVLEIRPKESGGAGSFTWSAFGSIHFWAEVEPGASAESCQPR